MTYSDMKNLVQITDDPVQKLELVMDFGKNLQSVPESAVCTEIQGCSSFVQICRDGNKFYANADSALVRGIVAIIIAMVDGKTADEIHNLDIAGEFATLGLNLGTARLAGVNSMIRFLHNL